MQSQVHVLKLELTDVLLDIGEGGEIVVMINTDGFAPLLPTHALVWGFGLLGHEGLCDGCMGKHFQHV